MFGFHLILDIFDCNIESIRDEAVIREFLNVLLHKIKMKKMAEPSFIYLSDENDYYVEKDIVGFTVFQGIETSSITIHFCEGIRTAYFDLFSCKCFDQDIVIDLFNEYFGGEIANQMFLSRNAK
jgi:S-adenosylmethionine/arginine decarboxylase-like enzyme